MISGGETPSRVRVATAADGGGFDLVEPIEAGNLRVIPGEGLAVADGRPLRLSVREFGLLAELARNQGRVVSREDLYREVWGSALRTGDRTIDVYVRRLRVKLAEQVPNWVFIHTHIGFGYRLQPEVSSPSGDLVN